MGNIELLAIGSQTVQAFVIVLGNPLEFDGQTLLLKTPHT